MTAKNPLKNAEVEGATGSRKGWTLQEHCDHANAQLILNNVNEDRRKQGFDPVHWVIRNGRVVLDWRHQMLAITATG